MTDLLTTSEVQQILSVDRTTIYRMVESGRLPAIRVGKQWRFSRPEIERWLRGQAVIGTGAAPGRGEALETGPRINRRPRRRWANCCRCSRAR